MWPTPELVYRRFNFVDGIPEEYFWAQDDPLNRQYGGAGIPQMTVETWLQMREQEKDNPSGHLGPTPEGNLARPKRAGRVRLRGVHQ